MNRVRAPLLRNTGSTARDHLASERTFLAWLRTGLGFIALGIAVERFAQLDIGALVREIKASNENADTNTNAGAGDSAEQVQAGGQSSSLSKAERSRVQTQTLRRSESDKASEKGKSEKGRSDVLVGALLGTGTGSIAYGTTRYFLTMRLLERGLFRPAFHGAAVLGVGVAGLAGLGFWGAVREATSAEKKVDGNGKGRGR